MQREQAGQSQQLVHRAACSLAGSMHREPGRQCAWGAQLAVIRGEPGRQCAEGSQADCVHREPGQQCAERSQAGSVQREAWPTAEGSQADCVHRGARPAVCTGEPGRQCAWGAWPAVHGGDSAGISGLSLRPASDGSCGLCQGLESQIWPPGSPKSPVTPPAGRWVPRVWRGHDSAEGRREGALGEAE